jgi:hypothetical protein
MLTILLVLFWSVPGQSLTTKLPWRLTSNSKISYLGQTIFKTGTKFESMEIGGLSGLSTKNNELWTITDKNFGGDNQCFIFDVDLKKNFLVTIKRKVTLKTAKNKSFPDQESDQESITVLPDGSFFSSMEGNLQGFKQHLPSIYYFNPQGIEIQQFSLDDKYLPNKRSNRGIFENKGPEAFTYYSENNQDHFIISSEITLKQDEQKNKYPIRLGILDSKKTNGLWESPKLKKEFLYFLDHSNTSLVDMVYYAPNTILTLERIFNPLSLYISGKIYKVTWNSITSDTQALERLEKVDLKALIPVTKKLLIDLDEVEKKAQLKLDNFEGITIIPSSNSNEVILGIVSDNNYNSMQQTVFAGFSIKKEVLK